MATKYDWLYSIEKNNVNVNRVVALNRLPFFNTTSAIAFVTKHFPGMTPEHKPIIHDPDMAQKIARISQYEVEYLIKELENVHDQLKALSDKEETKYKKLEEKPRKSLMDDVSMATTRERMMEYAHQSIGVNQAIMRLRSRMYELQALAGKQASEWRI